MEAALKQAKIDRRTAKSAFTRAGKAVVHDRAQPACRRGKRGHR